MALFVVNMVFKVKYLAMFARVKLTQRKLHYED